MLKALLVVSVERGPGKRMTMKPFSHSNGSLGEQEPKWSVSLSFCIKGRNEPHTLAGAVVDVLYHPQGH